jgi:hypothetical protein
MLREVEELAQGHTGISGPPRLNPTLFCLESRPHAAAQDTNDEYYDLTVQDRTMSPVKGFLD